MDTHISSISTTTLLYPEGDAMDSPSRTLRTRFDSPPKWLITWVPLITSLISFGIATYTSVITSRPPALQLVLPNQIRVAQGSDFGYAYTYFQPTFVNTGSSQRVEVIRDMQLQVQKTTGGAPVIFTWKELGKLDYDRAGQRKSSYVYTADATPLLVSPSTAQSPFGVFFGPNGWYFGPGVYRVTFGAERAVAATPLLGTFEIEFSKDRIDLLNAERGNVFIILPVRKL